MSCPESSPARNRTLDHEGNGKNGLYDSRQSSVVGRQHSVAGRQSSRPGGRDECLQGGSREMRNEDHIVLAAVLACTALAAMFIRMIFSSCADGRDESDLRAMP